MSLDTMRTKQLLKDFNFKTLFIEELGWDHHNQTIEVAVDGKNFALSAVAEKRGMVVFVFTAAPATFLPDYATRRKIEHQVAKSIHEHLIIYLDSAKTTQVWQWVRREAGKPNACREHSYHKNQPGDALIQKLQQIAFSFGEEEGLTLVDVTGRVRAGLDVERVTKKFYERFKTEHDSFLKFLKGIPDEEIQRWYASVMLNRLMFIYFIQKKGFLDNDLNYLRNKLSLLKQKGSDKFYADFLCPLFFEGFAKKESERSPAMNQLLGKVPYLNGGLFMRHQIEEMHGKTIQVADTAFEKIFAFFEQYQWHLDERPLRKDDEINPDVLGYIFEKYINQKQMGAYYTKEDITEYISKNTVIPFLFDAAQKKCKIAFEGEQSAWRLLQNDPDRYIYDAVKKGVDQPLPKEIAAGLNDVSKRTEWNKPAPEEYALPTEIWREVVARRKRYEEVCNKLANDEIKSINDFITYNLDIRQFAQDVIENSEGPELLRAFWHSIVGRVPEKSNQTFEQGITILDPTCGSGAFLFAALNILEPLYEACLDRMEVFIDELERSGEKHRSDKFGDFRKILERIEQQPNRRYFILKSIIVNNLYGVDIMEEAIEICKLRLFLKLVAQIERVEDIEPLPDIDFNIRAGNTLVGFVNRAEVKKATTTKGLEQKLIFKEEADSLQLIEEKAEDIDRLFKKFQEMQTSHGMDAREFFDAKRTLTSQLKELESELNNYLAKEYKIDTKKKTEFSKWLDSHKPFHWFIEFFGIIKNGGFDVIIGNPPYVEYSKIREAYTIKNYRTSDCGNLYAFIIELSLKSLKKSGKFGMIVPLSIATTERMQSLQLFLTQSHRTLWFSFFDVYPSKLFEGAKQRLSILLTSGEDDKKEILTTKYNRWKPEERQFLIQNLLYWSSNYYKSLSTVPKLSDRITESIFNKLFKKSKAIYRDNATHISFYVHRIPYNYIKTFNFTPYFWNEVDGEKKSEDYKPYCLLDVGDEKVLIAILNSTTFFWWWYTLFEGYHCGKHEIHSFPVGLDELQKDNRAKLSNLAISLMSNLKKNKQKKVCQYKNTGKVIYEEFYPRLSKSMIDEIDTVLYQHYKLTNDELDYIVNYDIKYRL